MPPLSHCAQLTRTHDRRRYLCALFAPPEVREGWFALFAFQHEIEHIADILGDELVGFVRYAWWRETVAAICNSKLPQGHPVAEALAQTASRFQAQLTGIVEAYETAMAEKRAPDEALFQDTYGKVMTLCAQMAGITPNEHHLRLGVAWGAMEAAAGGDKSFIALARHTMESLVVEPVFKPFVKVLRFTLRRLERRKSPESAVLLPISLWLS